MAVGLLPFRCAKVLTPSSSCFNARNLLPAETGAEAAGSTGVLTSRRSHYRDDEGHAFDLGDDPNDFTRSGYFESGTASRFSGQGSSPGSSWKRRFLREMETFRYFRLSERCLDSASLSLTVRRGWAESSGAVAAESLLAEWNRGKAQKRHGKDAEKADIEVGRSAIGCAGA